MAYGKVADSFYDDPKTLDCTNAALGLWAKGLSYVVRHRTDGHLTPAAVKYLGGTKGEIDCLVRSGYWEKNGNGWIMHDYDDWNITKAEDDERRRQMRERQRRHREG